MIKVSILLLYIILLLVVIYGIMVANREYTKYSPYIIAMDSIAGFSMLCYMMSLITTNKSLAKICIEIQHANMDWIILGLLGYIASFAGIMLHKKKNMIFFAVFVLLAVLDNISMYFHCFLGAPISLESTNELYPWFASYNVAYMAHVIFCYIIVSISVIILLVKSYSVSFISRKKYISFLAIFILVIISERVLAVFGLTESYFIYEYIVMSTCLFFFTYFYIPKEDKELLHILMSDRNDNIIACCDNEGELIFLNKTASKRLKEVEGEFSVQEYIKRYCDKADYNNTDSIKDEDVILFKDRKRYFTVAFERLRDKKGRIQGSAVALFDKTKTYEQIDREHYIATHDSLTGLLNRDGFFEEVEKMLREDPDTERYMVCSNIYDFKMINDFFGNETGDKIIQCQAELLKEIKHENCIYGRIGGDRFAIVLNKSDFREENAIKILEKFQEKVNLYWYKIHIYLGVYQITDPQEEIQLMLDKADAVIKAHRGNYEKRIGYYDARLYEQKTRQQLLINDFKQAMSDKRFEICLSPQVNKDGKVVCADLSARWKYAKLGVIKDTEFVPILEKTGFIYQYNYFVWEKAVEIIKRWSIYDNPICLAVKLSSRDFFYANLYETLVQLVMKYDVNPNKFVLQITEETLANEFENKKEILKKFKKFGFRLEIIHFGSGYSSLNLLNDIDVDAIKIDVDAFKIDDHESRGIIILENTVDMAKKLNMNVILEGIDSENTVQSLEGLSFDAYQGNIISKPIPVNDFEFKYLREEVIL